MNLCVERSRCTHISREHARTSQRRLSKPRDSIKNRPTKISPLAGDDPTANRWNPTIDNRDFPSSEHREYTRSCISNFTVYRIFLINATYQSSNSPTMSISKAISLILRLVARIDEEWITLHISYWQCLHRKRWRWITTIFESRHQGRKFIAMVYNWLGEEAVFSITTAS